MTLEIAQDIRSRGPMFYGSEAQLPKLAKEWSEEFSPSEAAEWMDAGFWCPLTASLVRDLGIAAKDVATLETSYDDPVYAMCNNDLSIDVLTQYKV